MLWSARPGGRRFEHFARTRVDFQKFINYDDFRLTQFSMGDKLTWPFAHRGPMTRWISRCGQDAQEAFGSAGAGAVWVL
jgi:hypothetical protein